MKLANWISARRGRRKKLADHLNVSLSLVSHWCSGRRPVRPSLCRKIEKFTDFNVSVEELRPDVFGHPAETGDDPADSAERAVGVAKTAGGRSAVAASDAREVA